MMLTDNEVLLSKYKDEPALMCVQRKAAKKVPTEADFIDSNLKSFGNDIGKITNRVTTMYDIRSKYPKSSEEYKILSYRIRCGQLYQQNAIDKAKGIVAKAMPREWYDWHTIVKIEDGAKRQMYRSISAENKPYFMKYIYPDLAKEYKDFITAVNINSLCDFQLTIDELKELPYNKLTEQQREFLRYFDMVCPVGMGESVMNRICHRFEEEFDSKIRRFKSDKKFDPEILKGGYKYTTDQYYSVQRLYQAYKDSVRDYEMFSSYERQDDVEHYSAINAMYSEFMRECLGVCQNSAVLCDILVDICYKTTAARGFAWGTCGEDIITNLLDKNGGIICYPVQSSDGEVRFNGTTFTIKDKQIGGFENEYSA